MLKVLKKILPAFLLAVLFLQCGPGQPSGSLPVAGDTFLLNHLLDSAWNLGKRSPDSSSRVARQALLLARQLARRPAETEALNRIGDAFEASGNFDSSLYMFSQAAAIDSASGLTYEFGRDQYHRSIVQKKKGRYAEAYALALSAMRLWEHLPDHRMDYARACIAAGNVRNREGHYDEAIAFFHKAKNIADSLHSEALLSSAENSIGLVYEKQRLFLKAFAMYDSSFRRGELLQNAKLMAAAANNIGNTWLARGEPDTALSWYERSLALKTEHGFSQDIDRTRSNIGLVQQSLRNYEKALVLHREAIKGFRHTGDVQAEALGYQQYGEAYSGAKKPDSAIAAFSVSAKMAHTYKMPFLLLESYHSMASAYADKKEYDSAYHYTQLHQQVRDSLEEQFRKATETDILFQEEVGKRRLLEKERERQDAENRFNRALVYALLAGIILLSLLFFFILKMYRERQRAALAEQQEKINRQKIDELVRDQEIITLRTMLETQEMERTRIAKDLHDGLSLKLSTVKLYYSLLADVTPAENAERRVQFEKGWHILDDACNELRHVAHHLVSGELMKLGLSNALSKLCDTIRDATHMDVRFVAFGMDDRLDNATEQELYQVVQELLTNILKHAAASEITVQINRFNGTLNLVVEDNGRGFEPARRSSGGMGLRNIEERVGQMNGTLQIDSSPGRGTTVIIDLKIQSYPENQLS